MNVLNEFSACYDTLLLLIVPIASLFVFLLIFLIIVIVFSLLLKRYNVLKEALPTTAVVEKERSLQAVDVCICL
jgi:hypothetical protein